MKKAMRFYTVPFYQIVCHNAFWKWRSETPESSKFSKDWMNPSVDFVGSVPESAPVMGVQSRLFFGVQLEFNISKGKSTKQFVLNFTDFPIL